MTPAPSVDQHPRYRRFLSVCYRIPKVFYWCGRTVFCKGFEVADNKVFGHLPRFFKRLALCCSTIQGWHMHHIPAFCCGLENHGIAVNVPVAAPSRVVHML